MKLTNLWYFFFNADAASSGAAEYGFDADGVGATTTVVVESDSRGWFQRRFHVTVPLRRLPAIVPAVGRPAAGADAEVLIHGVAARTALGRVSVYTDVSISTTVESTGSAMRTALGRVRVSADSQSAMRSVSAFVSMAGLEPSAEASVQLRGVRARTRAGHVGIEIGPDLIQQDDEELLFLLEVA